MQKQRYNHNKGNLMTSQANIFNHLTEHAKQIEQNWSALFQNICVASNDYPHLDIQRFEELNTKFHAALQRLHSDLESPTLILATTGTTSSGKSAIVNLLCGAELMPVALQEMNAGVVYIHHSLNNKGYLKVHETDGALWECGEWDDLEDAEILNKLTKVMDKFNESKVKSIQGEISKVMNEMASKMILHQRAVRDLLTPEQKKQFDERILSGGMMGNRGGMRGGMVGPDKMMQRGGRMAPGRGMGMHKGMPGMGGPMTGGDGMGECKCEKMK